MYKCNKTEYSNMFTLTNYVFVLSRINNFLVRTQLLYKFYSDDCDTETVKRISTDKISRNLKL